MLVISCFTSGKPHPHSLQQVKALGQGFFQWSPSTHIRIRFKSHVWIKLGEHVWGLASDPGDLEHKKVKVHVS